MNNNSANRSIQCTVDSCKNHCGTEQYCSLNKVSIGTHETNPKVCQCVDCESFVLKNS